MFLDCPYLLHTKGEHIVIEAHMPDGTLCHNLPQLLGDKRDPSLPDAFEEHWRDTKVTPVGATACRDYCCCLVLLVIFIRQQILGGKLQLIERSLERLERVRHNGATGVDVSKQRSGYRCHTA